MRPAREGDVPVRVKNSYNRQAPGTLITRSRDMSKVDEHIQPPLACCREPLSGTELTFRSFSGRVDQHSLETKYHIAGHREHSDARAVWLPCEGMIFRPLANLPAQKSKMRDSSGSGTSEGAPLTFGCKSACCCFRAGLLHIRRLGDFGGLGCYQ